MDDGLLNVAAQQAVEVDGSPWSTLSVRRLAWVLGRALESRTKERSR
jgi:hypothetical protein